MKTKLFVLLTWLAASAALFGAQASKDHDITNLTLRGNSTVSGNITSNATQTGGVLNNITIGGNTAIGGNTVISSNATLPTALNALKVLTPAADKLSYYSGGSSAALTDLTSYARTLLATGSASSARSTLGAAASGANADITALSSLTSITTGNLTITPTGLVDFRGTGIVYASSETNAAEFLAWTYHNSAFPVISGFRARGTRASPAAIQSEDSMLQLGGGGYNGSAFPPANAAEIWFEATENWSVGSNGALMAFYVTPNGTSAVDHIRAMWIENNGRLAIGLTRPDKPLAQLTVKDAGNTFAGFFSGQNQTNGVALGTSGGGLAQINAYSEINDAIGAVQTLGLQVQGGNLTVGNASSVVTVNGSTSAASTLLGALVIGTGTASTSIGLGAGVIRAGTKVAIGTPSQGTVTALEVYEPSATFAATFRGGGSDNLVAIGTSAGNVAQINGYNRSFGAVQTLGLQLAGGALNIGNAATVTTINGTTDATTSTAALDVAGGVLARAKIVTLSTITTAANVAWNLGAYTAGASTPDGYLTVTVAGATYRISADLQ